MRDRCLRFGSWRDVVLELTVALTVSSLADLIMYPSK